MQQIWADLIDALDPAQVDWILKSGREQRIESGEVLVAEDGEVGAIYFLIEGLLHARTRALGGQVLATLGPGEIVGEISFVDRQRASASVVAAEDGLVLALPRDVLEAQLAADDAFAASFYRALAAIICRRLRATASRLGSMAGRTAEDEDPALRQDVEAAVERLRRTLIDADTAAAMADGKVPEAVALRVEREFRVFERALNDAIGELLDPPSPLNQHIGLQVQSELLPYVSKTRLGERLYSKPRGYGGDFSALELIYQNEPSGSGPLGPLLDRCLLESSAIRALRGRRGIVVEEIRKTVDAAGAAGRGTARVMSIACGPATEIFDVFAALGDKSRLEPTLIDVDFQALLHVSELAYGHGLKDHVHSTVKNLVYLALGRGELEAPEQDLVYSLGLIDYFNDNMVLRVIDHVHGVLRPGGRILLGSFHPRNPSKAFLDHVLEWPLIHRTEDELSHLFERSAFARPATAVRFEKQQIYFVAECVKG
jgi:CRP-like cAMP-binding protein/SAM-dependent methyltransferase